MDKELKDTLDAINRAFSAFKEQNDERLRQIEAKGSADAVTAAAVDRANAAISDLEAKLRELETQVARVNVGGGALDAGARTERDHARAFLAQMRGVPADEQPEASTADLEVVRAYGRAFNGYLRRGDKGAGIQAALSVGSDPDGGYFVLPDRSGRIVQLIYESSPMRSVANVQPIGTDALEGVLDLDEADAVSTSETGARAETTTPQTGVWRIPAHEIYAEPRCTQKLLDDSSVDVGAWLEKKVADRIARKESGYFVNGTGINQARGFLTYPAGTPTKTSWGKIVQVNSGAAGAFAATNPGDKLIDLVFGIKAPYRRKAVFVMGRLLVAEARKLKDGQGNYLWQPDFTSQQGARLLGYSIVEMEDMPALAANSLSLAFGDFNEAYQIVDRQGIKVLRDPFTAKPYVKFYTTKRTGGDVVNFEALRIMKFAA